MSLNEQNFQHNNTMTPEKGEKKLLLILITAIISAVVVGASVYLWQRSIADFEKQLLTLEIDNLKNQIQQQQSKLDRQELQLEQSFNKEETDAINEQNELETDIASAKEALVKYFLNLSKKEYIEATQYHGSGYGYLQSWNPYLDKSDHAALLKNGCELNGLECLEIRSILNQQETSPSEFKFIVNFSNSDGTLFKRGPCCGATEEQMPTQTDFEFLVKKIDNEFKVATQPVYVP